MRPVTRGNPANYSININVSSNAALNRSLRADSLHFQVTVIWTLFNTYRPDLWQILDRVWLRVTQTDLGEINAPSTIRSLRAANVTIIPRIEKKYRGAANDLITNIGRFCSYCERPNPSPLAVEHVAPKANYPLTSLAWDNFFLSCTPCNVGGSGKGTNPQRATVRGWPGNTNNEQQYFTKIKNYYLWPEDAVAYRTHVPRLEYYDTGTTSWRPVPAMESVRLGFVTGQDYTQREITADIHLDNSAALYSCKVRVWMEGTSREANRANKLIGLNKDGRGTGNDPSTSDGRMYDRTLAWFTIVTALDGLTNQPVNLWPDKWRALISNSVRVVGYFSLWVRIIELMNQDDPTVVHPNPPVSLLTRFLADCLAPFPGTRTGQIP